MEGILKMNKKTHIDILKELKDYFSSREDEEHMKYDDHPMATIENLMNEDSPAPWDEEYLNYLKENKK